MVQGYHVIFGMYGFWLPNDPRGSWSQFVGSWELLRFGEATTVNVRQSVAAREHDHFERQRAKQSLKHAPVHLTGMQARAVGRGFANYVGHTRLPVYACAILPEHVHLVIGRTDRTVEHHVTQLKGAATRALNDEGIHPRRSEGKIFARSCWKVFLDADEDIRRAIWYVEENPIRERKPRQAWSFITPV